MSNPTKQPDRPWGNSSGLPERVSCPILNRKAELLRGDPEPKRHIMMLDYLIDARSFWRGRDEQLLAAAYEDPDDFWRVLLSKPRSIDSFAVLVTGLLIDPVEKDFMFDARTRREVSPAYFHVRNAIELADINGPIFVEAGRGRMVLPLEACRWFAASPLYRGFLTPSLLAFLDAPTPHALPLTVAGTAGETAKTRQRGNKEINDEAAVKRGLELFASIPAGERRSMRAVAGRVFDKANPATIGATKADREKRDEARDRFIKRVSGKMREVLKTKG